MKPFFFIVKPGFLSRFKHGHLRYCSIPGWEEGAHSRWGGEAWGGVRGFFPLFFVHPCWHILSVLPVPKKIMWHQIIIVIKVLSTFSSRPCLTSNLPLWCSLCLIRCGAVLTWLAMRNLPLTMMFWIHFGHKVRRCNPPGLVSSHWLREQKYFILSPDPVYISPTMLFPPWVGIIFENLCWITNFEFLTVTIVKRLKNSS